LVCLLMRTRRGVSFVLAGVEVGSKIGSRFADGP